MKRWISALAIAVAMGGGALLAAPVFVGSWEVDDGPFWVPAPVVYSGQEAAALLFGGLPTDYAISTVDANPANIDNLTWVSSIFCARHAIVITCSTPS